MLAELAEDRQGTCNGGGGTWTKRGFECTTVGTPCLELSWLDIWRACQAKKWHNNSAQGCTIMTPPARWQGAVMTPSRCLHEPDKVQAEVLMTPWPRSTHFTPHSSRHNSGFSCSNTVFLPADCSPFNSNDLYFMRGFWLNVSVRYNIRNIFHDASNLDVWVWYFLGVWN